MRMEVRYSGCRRLVEETAERRDVWVAMIAWVAWVGKHLANIGEPSSVLQGVLLVIGGVVGEAVGELGARVIAVALLIRYLGRTILMELCGVCYLI